MDEENKLSLKRVELSLTKFNEVAIPHHLDLLRQHKANIIKFESAGELGRALVEQRHAARVAGQLRALLGEMDTLRAQVRDGDLGRFDQLTRATRDTTLRAIVDYLGTSPLSVNRRSAEEQAAASVTSTESVGLVRPGDEEEQPPPAPLTHLQLQVDDQQAALREREAVLAGWCALQHEVSALHDAWSLTQRAAAGQARLVAATEDGVQRAGGRVAEARAHLAAAERLQAASYGVGGACAGALLGGPLGLLAGAKAGALCAAAGSLLGYLGARLLRPARPRDPEDPRARRDEAKEQ